MTDDQVPPVPAWLAKYPRAAECWNDTWPVLERTRIKPGMHSHYVAQYCVAYSDMRDALEHLERGKLVAEKRTVGVGNSAKTTVEKVTLSPYQSLYNEAIRTMERVGKVIGLDPINPLEETRKFADYADSLDGDEQGENVDDGTGTGTASPGDAGEPVPTNGSPGAAG